MSNPFKDRLAVPRVPLIPDDGEPFNLVAYREKQRRARAEYDEACEKQRIATQKAAAAKKRRENAITSEIEARLEETFSRKGGYDEK